MEYKDNGYGITQNSLDYWHENKHLIGDVKYLACSFNPLLVDTEITKDSIISPLEYTLKIVGTNGVIFLSGCNCGYGGEGPNGTRKILEELGINHDKAMELIYQKRFTINIGAHNDSPLCMV